MRLTLVNTLSHAAAAADAQNAGFFRDYYLPLELLTIATLLERDGHTVRLVDPNLIAHGLKTDESPCRRREEI